VLAELKSAGLAVVAASSWAQPRAAEAGPTWLCPSLPAMAESAAVYARREAKQSQVAVLDNGAPTSTAAAKAFAERFRAMGGKVPYEGSYRGDAAGLEAAVSGMTAHWPQMVFYAGDAASAGRLVLAMKAEKKLVNADLIGLPSLFEPAFFDEARLKSLRTRGLFPCPDFSGTGPLTRFIGFAFPKTSPEYKDYVTFAFRRPGRWTSMLFDATALAARALRQAAAPAPTPTMVPAVSAAPASPTALASLSGSAAALSPVAAAPAIAPEAPAGPPSRARVASALLALDGYRGIRGVVKFNATREPVDAKVMVYYALNKVNKKEMAWREKAYGPPF
jgi:ABC-type branched-subunit amino acid transport system substrate-binding protein